jgi:hypothetical protein
MAAIGAELPMRPEAGDMAEPPKVELAASVKI